MNTTLANQLGSNDGGGAEGTAVGADSISNQLAGMSKHQLYQIVSQMKDLIQQNQQQARQILIANPQLTKTLFQAQVMLGMVRAPETSPLATVPAQVPPQPTLPIQSQAPQAPPATSPPVPPPLAVSQHAPSQQHHAPGAPQLGSPYKQHAQVPSAPVQPAQSSQSGPSQVGSSYLQHAQVPSASVPSVQSFTYQQSTQPAQQSNPQTTMWVSHSQAVPAVPLPPPQQQHGPPQLPSQPPPLPQQPRPVVPSTQLPSSQFQPQNMQGMGFSPQAGPQSYLPPQPPFQMSVHQQQGTPLHTSSALPFQQMPPPLPTQPPPQHLFQQSPQNRVDTAMNMGQQATILPMGPTMGVPGAPLWNQTLPLNGSGVTSQANLPAMVHGHQAYAPPGGPPAYQGYNQAMIQPPPQQQLPQQAQMQMPIELEQQKALLQQVMNLTPEQINSLPPEQRQQVLQLQQAFRSQTG